MGNWFKIQGIYPPTVTPLQSDETIDETGLRRLLQYLLHNGVHGLYLLGSTGELPALRDSEKRRAMEITVDEVQSRVPIIVGVFAESTKRTLDNIRIAQACKVDAVAVTPPYYYPSGGEAEQIAHFRACAEASAVPVVIYNIPSTTKVMMAAETIAKLAEVPNIIGIKDSSGDWPHMLKILSYLKDNEQFSVLVGSPVLTATHVLMGGDGAVMGVGNMDPAACVAIYNAAQKHNMEEVWEGQRRIFALMRLLRFGNNIVCLKTALELLGICQSHACAPLQPLNETGRQGLKEGLRELGLLK
jgi:4-hydroxy-tetrahydrodipicolinate synthase